MNRHALLSILLCCGAACRLEMHDQPKLDAYQASDFFADGAGSRPIPAGTIPRGSLRTNDALYAGLNETNLLEELPLRLTRDLLERGRERFEIYCSPCHGFDGDGDGMIVQRGFPRPPTFHAQRLREAPLGHFYRVMTYGYGVMFSYAARVSPEDRWAIAAYIRALQFSRAVQLTDLRPEERAQLERSLP